MDNFSSLIMAYIIYHSQITSVTHKGFELRRQQYYDGAMSICIKEQDYKGVEIHLIVSRIMPRELSWDTIGATMA